MLYGIVRAIIQYMRYSAFKIKKLADRAYSEVAHKPSADNLGVCKNLPFLLI
jgi:hypothetical protein